jgi:hypothetical protein
MGEGVKLSTTVITLRLRYSDYFASAFFSSFFGNSGAVKSGKGSPQIK